MKKFIESASEEGTRLADFGWTRETTKTTAQPTTFSRAAAKTPSLDLLCSQSSP